MMVNGGEVCAVGLMVLGVSSANTLLNDAILMTSHTHTHVLYTPYIVTYVLEAQTGTMSAEGASMHALHTITNAHTHSIVLLVLEAQRKYCIITSCSTLSSQSHNTYSHFVHS